MEINYKTYRKLPTDLYMVKVPAIATYSEAEIDLFGIPNDYKDGKIVKNGYLDYSTVMLPVRDILRIYDNGYPIQIIDAEESVQLYKSLEQYIKDWTVDLRYSPNMKVDQVDNDYLMVIDKFLTEVFGFNKDVIVKDMAAQTSAYQVNIGVMTPIFGSGSMNNKPSPTRGRATGMMEGYGYEGTTPTEPEPSPITAMYRNPSQPTIDLDAIKRTETIKPKIKKRYSISDLSIP